MKLSQKEIDTVILAILCDGLYYFPNYGFEFDYNEDEYKEARDKLVNPCIEDVQLQMLKDGKGLTFNDIEGDGDHTKVLTMDLIKENIETVPPQIISDILAEDYDAGTADLCLQYLLYREIIFG